MAVYVDEVRVWPGPKPRCFNAGSCHLSADSADELHAFAARLRLPYAWFQRHRIMPHYDLTASRRAQAVAFGAVETTAREQALQRRQMRMERA